MAKALDEQQVQQFKDDGFLFPYSLYTLDEAAALWKKFNTLEEELGEEPQNRFRIKAQ